MNIEEVKKFIFESIDNGLKQNFSVNDLKESIVNYYKYLNSQNLLDLYINALFKKIMADFDGFISYYPNLDSFYVTESSVLKRCNNKLKDPEDSRPVHKFVASGYIEKR